MKMTQQNSHAISKAEKASIVQPDPVKMLAALHASGNGLSKEAGEAYLKEVYEDRKSNHDTLFHSAD